MTDEELIAWENGEWDQGWWDKRMVKIRAERGFYPDALMFLRADAEIKRLRKVANEILRYDMTIDGARMRLRAALKSAGEEK